MIAWGRGLFNAFNGFGESRETGLIRMFRTEYAKEYQWMKKNGCEITDNYVRKFLSERKHF